MPESVVGPCGVCRELFTYDPGWVPLPLRRPYCRGCARRLNAACVAAGREPPFDERAGRQVAGRSRAVLGGMKTLAEMLGFVLVGWAVTSAAAACMDAAAARAADRRARECAVCAAAVDVGPGEGHFPAWEAQLRTG